METRRNVLLCDACSTDIIQRDTTLPPSEKNYNVLLLHDACSTDIIQRDTTTLPPSETNYDESDTLPPSEKRYNVLLYDEYGADIIQRDTTLPPSETKHHVLLYDVTSLTLILSETSEKQGPSPLFFSPLVCVSVTFITCPSVSTLRNTRHKSSFTACQEDRYRKVPG